MFDGNERLRIEREILKKTLLKIHGHIKEADADGALAAEQGPAAWLDRAATFYPGVWRLRLELMRSPGS